MIETSVMNYNYCGIAATQVKEKVIPIPIGSYLDITKNIVNINGIDKDALLYALWFHAKPSSYGSKEPYDVENAKKQLIFGYAYIVCGKIIKCDIYNSDNVDKTFYDNENGDGMFLYIVNSLRYNV